MTKTRLHKKLTGAYSTPVEVPEVSFLHHWEKFRAIFGATGVVFDTCRPLFSMPQVSFLHHTYLSHPQKLFLLALRRAFNARDVQTRQKIGGAS